MRLRTLWLPIIFIALAGCGNEEELPDAPQLFVDRDSLGFDQEFGSGTYVGATTFNTLYIENKGIEPLELTEISISGAPEFRLNNAPPELSQGGTLRLETYKRAYVEVAFKPTDDKVFTGKLTIKSNAANSAVKEIALSGRGLPPPPR